MLIEHLLHAWRISRHQEYKYKENIDIDIFCIETSTCNLENMERTPNLGNSQTCILKLSQFIIVRFKALICQMTRWNQIMLSLFQPQESTYKLFIPDVNKGSQKNSAKMFSQLLKTESGLICKYRTHELHTQMKFIPVLRLFFMKLSRHTQKR